MGKSSGDKPLDLVRDAAGDPTVRRAALAVAGAVGASAAAKVTLDLRSAAHAPETDREFALHAQEPLPAGLRRIARGQIDTATDLLSERNGSRSGRGVHESRKALKRLRAMTRLLRDELGEERYRADNVALRDAGRRLAGARDAAVMVDTLEDIVEHELGGRASTGLATLRAELIVERQVAAERLLGDSGAIAETAAEIHAVRGRAAQWVRPEAGFDALAPGLDRIYRQGRRRLERASRDPSTEHLHDWRKRVKDLRHAAEVLAPADSKRMAKLAKRADRLGELLGSEHDLAVLGELVDRRAAVFDEPDEHRRLMKTIGRRRRSLRREALKRGHKLYAQKPRRFVKRIARDWASAQT